MDGELNMLVEDVPVWNECPFKNWLPEYIIPRRGKDDEGKPIILLHAGNFHAQFDGEHLPPERLKAMILNLGGAIFLSEVGDDPQVLTQLHFRKAICAAKGEHISYDDAVLWRRWHELTELREPDTASAA
jgi:hypothetical protein